jgi:phosphatidylglycerol:prolipoprotein diacylglycerol transferase
LTHLDEFRGRWIKTISPVEDGRIIGISGLTMLGGVVLVLIAIAVYTRVKKIPLLKLCDVMAPSFGLGIFITRIGCFLNGCCYGRSCEYLWKEVFPPWAVKFPSLTNPAGAAHPNVHIHPTQLYSSLYGLAIVMILIFLDRKRTFDGYLTGVFLMLYGFFRFWVDFLRDYESSVKFSLFGQAFTVNQGISFIFFCDGLGLLLYLYKSRSDELKTP